MIKLKKKQDMVKVLSPTSLEKAKKKNLWRDSEDKMEVLEERFGVLSTVKEEKNLKNLLFIKRQHLEKKGENFSMVINEENLVKI